jgi:hypothetical protein
MNQIFLIQVSRTVLTTVGIAFASAVFSPVMGQTGEKIPEPVAKAVLQELSQQMKTEVSNLQIVDAQQETWPDICLGMHENERPCMDAVIKGWHLTIANGDKHHVCRTNESGSMVKLEESK